MKRFIGFLLCGIMLFPLLGSVGCTSKGKSKQSPTNVFSLPKWKKEEPKTGSNKVKKDSDVPVTMSEAMMLPRNDVL